MRGFDELVTTLCKARDEKLEELEREFQKMDLKIKNETSKIE